jgi:hypothetical protein
VEKGVFWSTKSKMAGLYGFLNILLINLVPSANLSLVTRFYDSAPVWLQVAWTVECIKFL